MTDIWLDMAGAACGVAVSYTHLLKNAPVLPIAAFAATVFAAVAAAYSVGCRNVCRMSLAEMLREDALD